MAPGHVARTRFCVGEMELRVGFDTWEADVGTTDKTRLAVTGR